MTSIKLLTLEIVIVKLISGARKHRYCQGDVSPGNSHVCASISCGSVFKQYKVTFTKKYQKYSSRQLTRRLSDALVAIKSEV